MDDRLTSHILSRTGHRIHNLSVEIRPEVVVLRGVTHSYHVKQLALHGIRQLLPQTTLENAITVVKPDR